MVIVNAGGCPVTTKVRNIEKAGGQLAIIGNAFFDSVEDVYMEDVDGSGFSLTIPAFLIEKETATILQTAVEQKLMVKLKATLEISESD